MNFLSFGFILFFLIVCILYYALPQKKQNVFLLVSNAIFYASWNIAMIFVIIAETIFSYYMAIVISNEKIHKKRKALLIMSVIAALSVLLVVKYLNFSCNAIIGLINLFGFNISCFNLKLLVPLGISFFSFKIVSYLCDTYKGKIHVEKDLVKYSLYISFFPQVVSGPIERPEAFLSQLSTPRLLKYDNIVTGLKIVLWGFFKKMVIADNLAVVVNNVYNNVFQYKGPILLIATVLFAAQLYCDFSGYSDIAIGFARILGFNEVRNFECPYLTGNIKEFWAKWHISLSTWFRDYVYIPLGGNRVSFFRRCLNLMITFLVSGLWHGASVQFLIWGALNGLYNVIYIIYKKYEECKYLRWTSIFGKFDNIIFNFIPVCFAWIFFKANSFEDSCYIVTNMLNFDSFSFGLLKEQLITIGIDTSFIFVQTIAIGLLLLNDIYQCNKHKLLIVSLKSTFLVYTFSIFIILMIFVAGYYGPTMESQAFVYLQF